MNKEKWHINSGRGLPRYPFAVCAPYKDGLPGTAVLGAFAYRPHAETAMAALAADPANNPPGAPLPIRNAPEIEIGAFTIRAIPGNPAAVWIEHESGEGGEFDGRQLATAIAAFYGEHF